MGFFFRKPDPEPPPDPYLLWRQIETAAKARETEVLRVLLPQYRALEPDTFIDQSFDLFNGYKPGNSFALAMDILEQAPNSVTGVTETAQILLGDWSACGSHKKQLLRHNQYNSFSPRVAAIIERGEPERIRLALALCKDYLKADQPLVNNAVGSDDHMTWGQAAMGLLHNRAACITALKPANYHPDHPASLATIVLQDNKSADVASYPPLDKASLQALWALPSSRPPRQTLERTVAAILIHQPQKSLLDAIDAWPILRKNNLSSCLHSYLGKKPTPDPKRLALESEYRAEWEDRRLGILAAYTHMRPGMAQQWSKETLRDMDDKVLHSTISDLKQRCTYAAHHPLSPDAQNLKEELSLYRQLGALPILFPLVGTVSGFTSDLDYKTVLREHLLPTYFSPERRDRVMEKTCWAEYIRTKPLEHADSAVADYAVGV